MKTAQAARRRADTWQVTTLQQVQFCPFDGELPGRLPFRSIRYFGATARNLVGLHASDGSVTSWPVRSFELWGRTARMSGSDRHIANCAVAALDYVVPELTVSRPAIAASVPDRSGERLGLMGVSDLLVSGADETFTSAVLRGGVTRELSQLSSGAQISFEGRFVLLSELPGSPRGLRSLAEDCLTFLSVLPANAFESCVGVEGSDPLG